MSELQISKTCDNRNRDIGRDNVRTDAERPVLGVDGRDAGSESDCCYGSRPTDVIHVYGNFFIFHLFRFLREIDRYLSRFRATRGTPPRSPSTRESRCTSGLIHGPGSEQLFLITGSREDISDVFRLASELPSPPLVLVRDKSGTRVRMRKEVKPATVN